MGVHVSLHGRALGFDADTGAIHRYLEEGKVITQGAPGYGDNTVSAASTASNLAPRGISTMNSTAAKAYTLDHPVPGVRKVLTATGASTIGRTVTLASGATLETTAGSTRTVLTLSAQGQTVTLIGLSTASYLLAANTGGVTSS